METKIFKLELENIDERIIEQAAALLKQGEVVAFPTETVYGLGANALDASAVAKIFAAKGRPNDNPLIVHVHNKALAEQTAKLNPLAIKLMQAFWPGPLTFVLPKQAAVPACVTAGLDTVAIRMPDHPVALKLIGLSGLPIAAPSANLSGKPSPTSGSHVYNDLRGKIAMVLDGGASGVGLESTVLDLSGETPAILRPGAVTAEDLRPYCGQVLEAQSQTDKAVPKAPGMKYKHYAPMGEVLLVEKALLLKAYRENAALGGKVAVLATADVAGLAELPLYYPMAAKDDPMEAAHNLFAALRWCDEVGAETIIVQAFPKKGIGKAIMNRLEKAAAKK
ncbi:MAG: L-threonylcarbamoyladenylate synthase [Clostridia bacterium]|nr:L-threonylcarbamoyladenylate synthase [Clostridia bacterium]